LAPQPFAELVVSLRKSYYLRKLAAELSKLAFARANLSLGVRSWKGLALVEVANTCFGIRFAGWAGCFAFEVGHFAFVVAAGCFVIGGHFGADRSAIDGCFATAVVAELEPGFGLEPGFELAPGFELGPERFESDHFELDRFELVRLEPDRSAFALVE